MSPILKITAREAIIPFIILVAFWFTLVPVVSLATIVTGSVVATGTIVFCRKILFRRADFPLYNLRTVPVFLMLLARLLIEVVRSNVEVARTVLSRELRIQPQFVRIPAVHTTEFIRAVHAQCITLTPGTISVEVESDSILVHALTDKAAAGLRENFAVRALRLIEGIHSS
jgi:multicomponent Na+:H+ antiporter subunit E